jgi:hypothetical protein
MGIPGFIWELTPPGCLQEKSNYAQTQEIPAIVAAKISINPKQNKLLHNAEKLQSK